MTLLEHSNPTADHQQAPLVMATDEYKNVQMEQIENSSK
jgi:hypothetical protein